MKKYFLDIKITNDQTLLLLSDSIVKTKIKKTRWNNQRDLSEKLLKKIDYLLKKNNLSKNNIAKVNFEGQECGFMTEQTGKITAEILNFGRDIG